MSSLKENISIEIPEWKKELILNLKKQIDNGKKFTFIHTPKCGGLYAGTILKDLNINNKHHNQGTKNDGITFTIIREPAERFESLLNYRLGFQEPREDFPNKLRYMHYNKSISLNKIVNNMTDKDILNFKPYRSLSYWSKNVKLFITIKELIPTLELLGYEIKKDYPPINVSKKTRGKLDKKIKERIRKLYHNDCLLFKNKTRE